MTKVSSIAQKRGRKREKRRKIMGEKDGISSSPLTRACACRGAKGREGREEDRERMKYPPPPYACTHLHANPHAKERGDEMNAYDH